MTRQPMFKILSVLGICISPAVTGAFAEGEDNHTQLMEQAAHYMQELQPLKARPLYASVLKSGPDNGKDLAALWLILTFERDGVLQTEECRTWAREHLSTGGAMELVEKGIRDYAEKFGPADSTQPMRTWGTLPLPELASGEELNKKVADLAYSEMVRGGEALCKQGKADAGRRLLVKAMSSETATDGVSRAAASLIQTFQGNDGVDIPACQAWSKLNIASEEERVRVELAIGEFHFRNQNYDEAIEHLKELVSRKGQASESALLIVALCLQAKGDIAGAIERLNEAAANTSSETIAAKATFLIGWTHLQSREYAGAREAFDRLVQKYPNSEFASKATELSNRMRSYVE